MAVIGYLNNEPVMDSNDRFVWQPGDFQVLLPDTPTEPTTRAIEHDPHTGQFMPGPAITKPSKIRPGSDEHTMAIDHAIQTKTKTPADLASDHAHKVNTASAHKIASELHSAEASHIGTWMFHYADRHKHADEAKAKAAEHLRLSTTAKGASEYDRLNGAQRHHEWASKMTSRERDDVFWYVQHGYATTNQSLRQHGGDTSKLDEPTRKMVRNLDSALRKSSAPEQLTVERIISSKSGGHGGFDPTQLKPGSRIVDHAFMSTSAGGKYKLEGGTNDIRVIITVPKGTPGGFPKGGTSKEAEWLMPRNTALKIHKVESKKNGTVVYAEVES